MIDKILGRINSDISDLKSELAVTFNEDEQENISGQIAYAIHIKQIIGDLFHWDVLERVDVVLRESRANDGTPESAISNIKKILEEVSV